MNKETTSNNQLDENPKILNIKETIIALKKIINLFGIEILKNETLFKAALMDFLDLYNNDIFLKVLIYSIQIGVGDKVISLINASDYEKERLLDDIEYYIKTYGLSDTIGKDLRNVYETIADWYRLTYQKKSNLTFHKGDIVKFGDYDWLVLDVLNEKALLLANNITDIGIPFNKNTTLGGVLWRESSIRNWLNNEFLNRFSSELKDKITFSTILPADNPLYNNCKVIGSTEDKVFLLSINQVIHYFGDSCLLNKLRNFSTKEDINYKNYIIDDKYNCDRRAMYKDENTCWWLRSSGKTNNYVAYVNNEGQLLLNGELAFDDINLGVRPAIWVKKS